MNNTTDRFDVFGHIFHYGNRQDFEYMGDDGASWEATAHDEGVVVVDVYDDEGNVRQFIFEYKEVNEDE